MDRKRAKRARKDAGAAAGGGAAAAAAAAEPRNAFDALPDELVLQIVGLVEVGEAWEVARLQQLDRRFRQLVGSGDVRWQTLGLAPDPEEPNAAVEKEAQRIGRYKALLDRMADRVRGGAICGVAYVGIELPASKSTFERNYRSCYGGHDPRPGQLQRIQDAKRSRSMGAAALSVASLLAALATATEPVKSVEVSWPRDSDGRTSNWPPTTMSLKDVFSSCICALAPAPGLRRLAVDGYADIFPRPNPVAHPDPAILELPTLRELELRECSVSKAETAALVQACPNLRTLCLLRAQSGAAVQPLSGLPKLRKLDIAFGGLGKKELDAPLVDLSAGCRRLRCLRLVTDIYSTQPGISKVGLRAVLGMGTLRKLAITVADDVALGGLSALPRLADLELGLVPRGSADAGAALLRAAAAALRSAPALRRLSLGIAGGRLDEVAAVELLGAARDSLTCLHAALEPPFGLVLRQLAAGGPQLRRARLDLSMSYLDLKSVQQLVPLHELLPLCTAAAAPAVRLSLRLPPSATLRQWARGIVAGWFGRCDNVEVAVED